MCDEFTSFEPPAAGVSRRNFTLVGASAALGACAPRLAGGRTSGLAEAVATIPTGEGIVDAFWVHPARGRHPAIIMWPDIAGLREANRIMARQLAGQGYAVLVINQYYRSSRAPVLASFAEWRTPDGQAVLKPMIAALTPDGIGRDAAACVAWLDSQEAVDRQRGIGVAGYCMGGPFAVRTAWAVPARVRAAASFHGGGLVTDRPDSPHRLLARTNARFLLAVARNDDARAPGEKDVLQAAAAQAGRSAEIEVYPADHGWTVPDSPVYDPAQAERAFSRTLALFATL